MTTMVSPAALALTLDSPSSQGARETELDCIVEHRHAPADGVVSLTLRAAHGGELPAWSPGAHIDLVLDGGIVRQYSLCGTPADRERWRIAVLRDPRSRGGSARVHDRLVEGATVRVRWPRNHFTLSPSPAYLFIAGGIGITPILPMIAEAEAAGAEWRLLYGGRRRASMAFLDELAVHGDRVEVVPEDERGLLDLSAALGTPHEHTLVYCCGPEPLLAAVEERCAAWPPSRLHVERFAARPSDPTAGDDSAFEVVLQQSGITLTVPADCTILDVCAEAGLSMPSSCREGICGTCETVVLDGTPDHRDSVLTDGEREACELMMICVSRCHTARLVLDL